ncbi:MAG: hypothetical protein QM743_10350 [Chitinophagaceae bacterium]
MTNPVIITICVLLLLAYIFDLSAAKTKIPSVILLLALGWIFRQGTMLLEIPVPNLSSILPILGTVGLILIVMEGSLELELNREKLPLVGKATIIATLPMILFSFGLAWAFSYYGLVSMKVALASAIPLAIISSAIAIPSAHHLAAREKEFVTYESSISDIIGVILFNFITLNDTIGVHSFIEFTWELVVMLIVSALATAGLAFLLSKIKHHVKFVPIILAVVLIYTIAKTYHLPSLLFILLFGLFLGNLNHWQSVPFIHRLHPETLDREVDKFKELTTEIAFLIRALFFLLFGFLIETRELLNPDTIVWALAICAGIYVIRFVFLKLFRMPGKPLLFIAPRGLITILLFLSIPAGQIIPLANKSLIIQVIILNALVMMFGLMTYRMQPEQELQTKPAGEPLPAQD